MPAKRGLGKGLDTLIPGGKKEAVSPQESGVSTKLSTKSTENVDKLPENLLKEAVLLKMVDIERNKEQPRENFDQEALEELAESIRQYGVLQPLLVKPQGSRFVIVAGERRWRAAKLAGLKEIPAIIREYSKQEIMEISLIENIQREDLNVMEEAAAYRKLMEEFGYRQEDLAQKISKSRTAVANRLRLLKLPAEIQEYVKTGESTEGHARALLSLEQPADQLEAAKKIAEGHLSVREAEKLVKKWNAPAKEKKTEDWKESDELAYRKLEDDLKRILSTKVEIKRQDKQRGKIVIDYYSLDDLEQITEKLGSSGRNSI